jgi:isoquinoline 1-oxidoreductase beta subunit
LSLRYSGVVRAEDKKYGAEAESGGTVDNPLVFVAIAEDGTVTITVHRPEMGQGIRTSLALVIADELEADWDRIRVVQAPGDEAKYGAQNTDGSRSMRHFFEPMRRVGAAARMMLEAAAAARWEVPLGEVHASSHEVLHAKTRRHVGYGELASEAMRLRVPSRERLRLKTPELFRYIGKDNPRLIDGADMVTGHAQYGIDVQLPGQRYAVIARPPVHGGKVSSFDSTAALAVPGVVRVVSLQGESPPPLFHPLGGVAVIARNTWAAIEGRKALKLAWDDGPNASYDSVAFRATVEAAARAPAKAVRNDGDALGALAMATRKVTAEYYLPHLAHASMEPPAATARIVDGRCEVWACVQAPQATRDAVAAHLGLKSADVTVNVTLLGGGFGRKSKPDFAVEAALLSKAMQGAPVKVTWTREDDLRHDYYHTVSLERLEAALDENRKPVAWLHRSAAPTIASTFSAGAKGEQPFETGMTAINVPFEIPNIRLETPEVEAHTRIGWFRSVSNIPHAFATQCFVAELAAVAERDPKDYLLELIGAPRLIDTRSQSDSWNYGESPVAYPFDTARLRQVIERAAHEANWGRKLGRGHGLGIAASYSFLTYVAAVAEVTLDSNRRLSIPRIDVAIDCGRPINPDRIRSQVEGSCVMGASLALSGEITFQNGRAQQSNFHEYQVMRMSEAPREIRVHLIPGRPDLPLGGIGEPAVPPIAPAICNAIFAATGQRIRRLPVDAQLASGQS